MYNINVEKLEVDDYYGFEIDGNKRFVLGDFTVTHNTSISLYLLSQLKKKTLVIVHKEFLMNQWVERIQQFLPTARIGKIQGQVIDIDGKDIVLCMLQSLVLKEYPSSLFDSFGFTILDEVHHISSETFSNALFKVVTKYMLGLSATMDRKDGTTKIFKMFLGDVIHKVERKDEYAVEVRAVTYKTNDEEFNDTILDFKGQPQISSMISKLCTYNRRTEFIIQTIVDFICLPT
jgi:superfamily II DNA or RNA helicase